MQLAQPILILIQLREEGKKRQIQENQKGEQEKIMKVEEARKMGGLKE